LYTINRGTKIEHVVFVTMQKPLPEKFDNKLHVTLVRNRDAGFW